MPRPSLPISALAAFLLAAAAFAGDLEDAQSLQQSGKYEQALPKYEAAAAVEGASAEAFQGLSEVLAGLGRYEEAAEAADKGLDAHAGHLGLLLAKARAWMLQADANMRAGQDPSLIYSCAAECDAALLKILAKDAQNADANVLKAKVLQHQGDHEGALELLMKNAEAHPAHFDTHWEIGQHWFRAGGQDNKNKTNWENARRHFDLAFEADPTSGDAILHATYSAHWMGETAPELAKGYEKAALLLPGHGNALKQLNASLSKRPEEREAAFKRIYEKYPENLTVIQWYAYVLRLSRNYTETVKLLKAAAKAHPENAGVVKDLAATYLDMGDGEKAIAKYEEYLDLRKPNYVKREYDAVNAVAFQADLDVKLREKLWTALWNAYPTVPDAANNAGLWYRDIGKDDDASLKWYLRASKIAPTDVRILNDTGLIYDFHFKDHDKAEPYYRRAIDAAKDQGVAWSNDPNNPGMGFRDALNNLCAIFAEGKRWKDLAAVIENDMPSDFPMRGRWRRTLENKGK